MESSFLRTLPLLFLLLPPAASLCHAQGSLTPPPGPPAPTMKTLDQIESRTPVQSLAAAAPYAISQPGSYFLTGNITVASGDAIIIASDDVSLDLNGFTIRSTQTGGTSGAAIHVPASQSRLTIRNGFVVSGTTLPVSGFPVKAGFTTGIASLSGQITRALVSEIHVSGVGNAGIYLNDQGLVERCTASHCGSYGIFADQIRDCTAKECYLHALHAREDAVNCVGFSRTGDGVHCSGNAANCTGESVTGTGLYSLNAANCIGRTGSGLHGLRANGTASFCHASRSGAGVALNAANAVGCTVIGSGTVTAISKSLGTP